MSRGCRRNRNAKPNRRLGRNVEWMPGSAPGRRHVVAQRPSGMPRLRPASGSLAGVARRAVGGVRTCRFYAARDGADLARRARVASAAEVRAALK
jgi:hypothetical protein